MKHFKCFMICLFILIFINSVSWGATYSIDPDSLNVSSSGGSFNIDVTSIPSGEAAFVVNFDTWITFGIGSTVTPFTQTINVEQNDGFCPRTGTVSFSGTGCTVTQESAAEPMPDTNSPIVCSISPSVDAVDVAVNTTITAIFSEAMDSSTITTNEFIVSSLDNIAGTVTYNGTTAIFTPSADLDFSKTYTVTITTEVNDNSGNTLLADYIWSFTTIAEEEDNDDDGGGGGGCFIEIINH